MILLAQYIEGNTKINRVEKGKIFNVEPNVPHNVYMYPNTVLHTVKYGEVEEYDWQEFKELDNILKNKTMEELEKYIQDKIEERKIAKQNKDYALSDAIRDELLAKGIELIDTREGTTYKINK